MESEPAVAAQLDGVCNFAGTKLDWVPVALGGKENIGSPLHCILNIAQRRIELTPASENQECAAERLWPAREAPRSCSCRASEG